MFWKGIVEELLFFIRGDTNTNLLSNKGIKIWELNTRKDFLDKLGLNYPEGEMGPMYGYQWRKFNDSVDQLTNLINELKRNPFSRRLLMTDFNPCQVDKGVLYPCHSIIIQMYINDNKLSCTMYQRSGDLFLGIPFNIASTSLLVHIIAKLTKLDVGTVNLVIGDYHIYQDHKQAVLEQLSRTPYDLSQLDLPDFNTLEQVEKSSFEDYKIINYQSHKPIKAIMFA
jgi:thymidylate synthase